MLMFCNTKGELATVKEIAAFYHLPEKFLFKIAFFNGGDGVFII